MTMMQEIEDMVRDYARHFGVNPREIAELNVFFGETNACFLREPDGTQRSMHYPGGNAMGYMRRSQAGTEVHLSTQLAPSFVLLCDLSWNTSIPRIKEILREMEGGAVLCDMLSNASLILGFATAQVQEVEKVSVFIGPDSSVIRIQGKGSESTWLHQGVSLRECPDAPLQKNSLKYILHIAQRE